MPCHMHVRWSQPEGHPQGKKYTPKPPLNFEGNLKPTQMGIFTVTSFCSASRTLKKVIITHVILPNFPQAASCDAWITIKSHNTEITQNADMLIMFFTYKAKLTLHSIDALSLLSPGLITHLALSHLRALLSIAPLVACH